MTKRILIVDDEEDITELITDLIQAEVEVDIDTAVNGVDALALAKNSKYDLIITDHKMPLMTGKNLINEIKLQKTINNTTPIILNSAFLSEIEEDENLEGVEIVDKSIDIKKLIESVTNFLS